MSEKASIANQIHWLLTILCGGALLVLGLLVMRGKIEIRQIDQFSGAAIEYAPEGEKYFAAAGLDACCFKYEGTLIDCWIEAEKDGEKSQIGRLLLESLDKDGLSAIEKPSGHLVWARLESGDEELWFLGIDAADINGKRRFQRSFFSPNQRKHGHTIRSEGRFSLNDGNEISLARAAHLDIKGENGKPEWSATLKCKAAK